MNWLTICVLAFLVLSTLAGAKRGLIKSAFSFTSFFLTILIVSMVREPITEYLREHTELYTVIEDSFTAVIDKNVQTDGVKETAGEGSSVIEGLNLPELIKESLLEQNRNLVYQELGVSSVEGYVTARLVQLAFQAICYIIAFVVVWVALRLSMVLLSMITQLPVIHQIDSLAGAACGFLIALLLIWIGGMAVTAFAATDWGSEAMLLISESELLSFLYNHNILVSGLLRSKIL